MLRLVSALQHLRQRNLVSVLQAIILGLIVLQLALPQAYLRADDRTVGDPFVRPGFAALINDLRPQILAAAERHNQPADSGMSDREFAAVIALILYNEHVGWAEELWPLLQVATPGYQDLQRAVNQSGIGSNFSVWPANLRPSVAAEILRGEIPLADGTLLTMTLTVAGSNVDVTAYSDQRLLAQRLSYEIAEPYLAVEYLAANLARGAHRARHEGIAVDWRVLAAWHNRGLVDPAVFNADPAAVHYLERAGAYRDLAERLVNQRLQVVHDAV